MIIKVNFIEVEAKSIPLIDLQKMIDDATELGYTNLIVDSFKAHFEREETNEEKLKRIKSILSQDDIDFLGLDK